jgi:hypothetical protein
MKLRTFLNFTSFLYASSVSYILYQHYVSGDLVHYRKVYSLIGTGESEKIITAINYFGFFDIVYVLFYFIPSSFNISHSIINSVINGFFCYLLCNLFLSHSRQISLLILLLSNFYLWVILIPGERTKLMMLFLLVSVNYKKNIFYLFSVFSHVSGFILILSGLIESRISSIFNSLKQLKIAKGTLILFITLLIFPTIILILFDKFIVWKINSYNMTKFDLIKLISINFYILLIFKGNLKYLIVFLPLTISVLIFGGETRINMFFFILIFYFKMKMNFTNMWVIMPMMIYFSLKNVFFIKKIFETGQGF